MSGVGKVIETLLILKDEDIIVSKKMAGKPLKTMLQKTSHDPIIKYDLILSKQTKGNMFLILH